MPERMRMIPKPLIKRARECRDVMIESAQVNGFEPLEALLATEEIFASLLIENEITKDRIEFTIDRLKEFIFKQLDNNIKSCQKK